MTVDLLKDLKSKNENNVCFLIQGHLLSFPLFEDYIQKRAFMGDYLYWLHEKRIAFCAIHDDQKVLLK